MTRHNGLSAFITGLQDTPERAWFGTLAADWINTASGIIGIGAARPFEVPVTVDVRHTPPVDDAELRQADHVTQAGAVRIYSHGLRTVSSAVRKLS